jgi:hypothetical protein
MVGSGRRPGMLSNPHRVVADQHLSAPAGVVGTNALSRGVN